MKIVVTITHLKKLVPHGFKSHAMEQALQYRIEDSSLEIELEALKPKHLDALEDILTKAKGEQGVNGTLQKIAMYKNLLSEGTSAKLGRLEHAALAIRKYIEPSAHKWLFEEQFDGNILPYYVESVEYFPYDRPSKREAFVRAVLRAVKHGSSDTSSFSISAGELKHKPTVVEFLTSKGFYLETSQSVAAYFKHIERYKALYPLVGEQFYASGIAEQTDDEDDRRRYYGSDRISMDRDGVMTKVVLDNIKDKGKDRKKGSTLTSTGVFWGVRGDPALSKDPDFFNDDDDDATGGSVVLPVHPYLYAFDLSKHRWVDLHVANIHNYPWDETMAEKLVLPQHKRDLINILMTSAGEQMEDIVLGKTGGTIVLALGPAGTGKTLTAEVYSEHIKRPLYVVQCSQLGTDEETVEKKLEEVLERASRWKAILLIDEADVYIRTRGNEIQQNAIVGVFLRVLEYYRGILFMTSNRETVIDDAIMSRATAIVRYEMPTPEELVRIYNILVEQFKITMPRREIADAVKKLPHISGRNVKNMLKLAARLAKFKKEKMVTADGVVYVAQFQDIDQKGEK